MTRVVIVLASVLLAAGCTSDGTVDGLTVRVHFARKTVGIHDTLSGHITLANTTLRSITVNFPAQEQAELLFFTETGKKVVAWPAIRHEALSELELGPWGCQRYEFRFVPDDFRTVATLGAGRMRVRARPADHEEPYTETYVNFTN